MPVIFQYKDEEKVILVWEIEEQISFFIDRLPGFLQALPSGNENRNLEWLASRYLLQLLIPEIEIEKTSNNKPLLIDDPRYISISHTVGYAAVMVSQKECGIDIENDLARIKNIATKFILPAELEKITSATYQATLYKIWCAKEAMFKAYGLGEVDFKNHLWVDLNAIIKNQNTFNGILKKQDEELHFILNYTFLKHKIHLVYGEVQ